MRARPTRFDAQASEAKRRMEPLCLRFTLSRTKEEEDTWGLTLVYQNLTTGLQLEFSPAEQAGWRAVIARLVDGNFPKHPIRITDNTELNRFDLRDLAAERIANLPELEDKVSRLHPLDLSELTQIVECCASDVMAGDFAVFPKLKSRVLARAQAPGSRP